jgi:hypothetical protein
MTQEDIILADEELRYTSLDWSIDTGSRRCESSLEIILHVVSQGLRFVRKSYLSITRTSYPDP